MIVEIGSHRFPGFYESIFCNSDEFIYDEYELKGLIEEIVIDKELEVVYEYENFEQYKKDVSKTYLEYYVEKIIDCLPSEISDADYFKFEIIDDEDNIEVISPTYYNYRTDSCYCLVETNIETLQELKNFGLKNEEDVQEYLRNHFTSYEGFHSFISNDIEYWKQLDINEYVEETRYLIALLDIIIALNDSNGFDEIRLSTYYDVDKYYYAEPIVYCSKESKDIILNNNPNIKIKTV